MYQKIYGLFMQKAYGIGAAIVIIGALLKLLHYKNANTWLKFGMLTEALVFLLMAFEPKKESDDIESGDNNPKIYGSCFPNKLNKEIDEVANKLNNSIDATNVYHEKIKTISENVEILDEFYGNMVSAVKTGSKQLKSSKPGKQSLFSQKKK